MNMETKGVSMERQFDISLVVPTRSRIPYLTKMLQSAFRKAKNPTRVELILLYDSDDPATREVIKYFKNEYSEYEIVAVEVYMNAAMAEQGINIHTTYFAPGARMARAPIVWELGNDVEIITQDYDAIMLEEVNKFLSDKMDRICYIAVDHDEKVKTPGFCCFPAFSRESIQCVGCGVPMEITSWGSDYFAFQIYKSLCENRILDLSDKVSVIHWSYHSQRVHEGQEVKEGDAQPDEWRGDEISYRLRTNVRQLTQEQFASYVNKLNARILKYKS
jgi:hypothetical protein